MSLRLRDSDTDSSEAEETEEEAAEAATALLASADRTSSLGVDSCAYHTVLYILLLPRCVRAQCMQQETAGRDLSRMWLLRAFLAPHNSTLTQQH